MTTRRFLDLRSLKWVVILSALFWVMVAGAAARAQGIAAPTPFDQGQLATKQEVAAAQAQASAARTDAAAAAAVPPVCAAKPSSDTATGTPGTAAPCVPRQDAARATQVMPATAATGSDGSFSGSWPGAGFTGGPTIAFASIKSVAEPYLCQVGTFTATSFSGKCWRLVAMTLPSVVTGVLNAVLVPYGAPPTGSVVMVSGRQ